MPLTLRTWLVRGENTGKPYGFIVDKDETAASIKMRCRFAGKKVNLVSVDNWDWEKKVETLRTIVANCQTTQVR
jgi:hypothetical protein